MDGGYQLKRMQDQQSLILQLPLRKSNLPVRFPKKTQKRCLTNYFEIDFKDKHRRIHQFSFETEPPIPPDSKDLLHKAIRSLSRQIKDKIKMITYSGSMLWGEQELKVALIEAYSFKFEGQTHKFEAIIKPVKSISLMDMMALPQGRNMVFQVMNTKIKQVLREREMEELVRGKYFDKQAVVLKDVQLSIINGYSFTLCPLKSGIYLQVDACSRVFRTNNLLEELKRVKGEIQQLIGATVITNYGKRRIYHIEGINYNMNPESTFWHQKKQGQISFKQYYKESYGLDISHKNQPMVEVVLRTERTVVNDKLVEKKVLGYLVPELISLTGISQEMMKNGKVMNKIAKFTRFEPNERVKKTGIIVDAFNDSGFVRIGAPKQISAYQLQPPQVLLKDKQKECYITDGIMQVRGRVIKTPDFHGWAIVYSIFDDYHSRDSDHDAELLFSMLKQASKAFDILFKSPVFLACSPSLEKWKKGIQSEIQKNGPLQIIVLFLEPEEEKWYGELKRFITCELKTVCQVVRKKGFLEKQKKMPIASKLVLQMNQKVGGTAWVVAPGENSYILKKTFMYAGVAFSKGKGKDGYTISLVGTIDRALTQTFSSCKTDLKIKEAIPSAHFEGLFADWLKEYVSMNNEVPQLIIVYREGLSIQQMERQCKDEVEALHRAISSITKKIGQPNHSPEVIYVLISTKINARIFEQIKEEGKRGYREYKISKQGGKMEPVNPESGTVVLDELSVDERYDFHLCAQNVRQGSCTPVHLVVAHNTSKMSQEELIQLTYDQCFNYYNWGGAVKVPGALQCANKVAKLASQHIRRDVASGPLTTTYYYL